ncbi:M20/M25/M40 family metallo-hydrolase [Pseudoroseicyclus aestuarii]|uniref:Di/tripeptidase n=1 Tax=Pseudoroseicyclus aestuarii TaxID=1795041 RepID=A0A318SN64_9RHOB|nr:M20/M25/M40 family metallo-hydrolase [Pseudoroseicyclus aestuarii]PYE80634.1 di/tripeptidase [Pseudoroseicyclus aestuarii]
MTQDMTEITAAPAFQAATAELRSTHDAFVDEIVELTQIPAPPFAEEVRAKAYEAKFRALGLEEVGNDAIGNVTGLRRGRGNGRTIVVAAHLDTVFPAGTDVTVRREGTVLRAPGVGDDTRGLAALLAFVRALGAGGVETEADILFVGDVGEEGKGDLRGVRHLLTEGPWAGKVEAFFTIDGLEPSEIVTTAVGSLRYRIGFAGPGGHSFAAFGTANPAYALGQLLTGMAALDVPKTPRTTYSASVMGGGTSINAIPEEAWVEIDLRSEEAGALQALDAQVRALAEAAARDETARAETGEIALTMQRSGARPAGTTPDDARIVQATRAALTAFGFTPSARAASTDANIPMSLGIPALCLGSGGTGGRAHSLDEWIDVEEETSLRGLNAALAAIVATAGLWARD